MVRLQDPESKYITKTERVYNLEKIINPIDKATPNCSWHSFSANPKTVCICKRVRLNFFFPGRQTAQWVKVPCS